MCFSAYDLALPDEGKWSALMVACASDNYYMCEYLIKAGADLDLLDPFNQQSALMIAAGKDSVYTARLLVSEGADLDLKDYRYVHVGSRRGCWSARAPTLTSRTTGTYM